MSKIAIIEGYLHNTGIKSVKLTNKLLRIDDIMEKQSQIRNKCNEIGNLRLVGYRYPREYRMAGQYMPYAIYTSMEWYIQEG